MSASGSGHRHRYHNHGGGGRSSSSSSRGGGGGRKYNRYNDVEVEVETMDCSTPGLLSFSVEKEFYDWSSRLGASSSALFWLHVPTRMSFVVPWLLGQSGDAHIAISRQPFIVHHASQDQGFMLVRPFNAERCDIPLYGTHYVRVECVVVEETTGHVLVIREGSSVSTVGSGPVKMVTGSVEPGEYMGQAAEREVLEETRIRTKFLGVIGFGHRLKTRYDKDELLVGCLMRAEQGQIPDIAERGEIGFAAWMPPETAAGMCNPMARDWLSMASRMTVPFVRAVVPDFRGGAITMELHAVP